MSHILCNSRRSLGVPYFSYLGNSCGVPSDARPEAMCEGPRREDVVCRLLCRLANFTGRVLQNVLAG